MNFWVSSFAYKLKFLAKLWFFIKFSRRTITLMFQEIQFAFIIPNMEMRIKIFRSYVMQQTTRDWETNETASILSWNLVIFLCPNTTWLMRQNKDNFLLFGSIVCVIFLLFPLRLPSLLQQLLPSACNLAHFVLQQKSFSSLISDFNQLWRFALKVKSVNYQEKADCQMLRYYHNSCFPSCEI